MLIFFFFSLRRLRKITSLFIAPVLNQLRDKGRRQMKVSMSFLLQMYWRMYSRSAATMGLLMLQPQQGLTRPSVSSRWSQVPPSTWRTNVKTVLSPGMNIPEEGENRPYWPLPFSNSSMKRMNPLSLRRNEKWQNLEMLLY